MRHLLILPIALLIACPSGDDDDSASGALDCSFSDCGGDPTGTWTLADVCLTEEPSNPLTDACPDAEYAVVFDLTGSSTFSPDGSYAQSYTRSATFEATYDPDCMAGQGYSDCAFIQDDIFSGDATCTEQGDSCFCTGVYLPEQQLEHEGTWTSTGSRFSVTLDGLGTFEGDFCVQGDVLKTTSDDVAELSIFTR